MEEISRAEEWVNSLTHYFGVILALIGTGALIVKTLESNNTGYFIGSMFFSFTLLYVRNISYFIYWKFKKNI